MKFILTSFPKNVLHAKTFFGSFVELDENEGVLLIMAPVLHARLFAAFFGFEMSCQYHFKTEKIF